MSSLSRKKRKVALRGWIPVFGSIAENWITAAKLPRQSVATNLFVPVWVLELYLRLLPDEPPATEEHLAPMFAVGRALAAKTLTRDAVEAAHRVGGPAAVVGLARGLT